MLPRITVRKLLIDGRQWGTWQPYVLPLGSGVVALWTPQGTEMRWATGDFRASYNGVHYWWPGARYLIGAHFAGANGDEFWGCYCDVVMPLPAQPAHAPEREYVDLLLDLVVRPDRSWYSKDQEVYDRAERAVPALRAERPAADETLRWLEQWARDWSGPFARIPARLPRTDWHELDADSAAFMDAASQLLA